MAVCGTWNACTRVACGGQSVYSVCPARNWEPGVGRLQEEASESVPFEIPSEVVVAGDFNVPPYYPQMSFDLLSKHIAQEGDFDQMATTVMFLGSTSRTVGTKTCNLAFRGLWSSACHARYIFRKMRMRSLE